MPGVGFGHYYNLRPRRRDAGSSWQYPAVHRSCSRYAAAQHKCCCQGYRSDYRSHPLSERHAGEQNRRDGNRTVVYQILCLSTIKNTPSDLLAKTVSSCAISSCKVGPPPLALQTCQRVTTLSDSRGMYRLTGVTTAVYNICVYVPGEVGSDFADKRYGWVAAAEGVSAEEGRTTQAPDLVVGPGVLIHGTVLDQATRTPLRDLMICCFGPQRPASSSAAQGAIHRPKGQVCSTSKCPEPIPLTVTGVYFGGEGGPQLVDDDCAVFHGALWTLVNRFTTVTNSGSKQIHTSPVSSTKLTVTAANTTSIVVYLDRKSRKSSL